MVWHATNLIYWKAFLFSEVLLFYNFTEHTLSRSRLLTMEKYFKKLNINHYHQSLIEGNYFCEGHFDVSYAC